jgi:hypothetical protein
MINNNTKFEIIECICSWYDLLGFGKPLADSKWNLKDEQCKAQLERITSLDLSYTNKFSSSHGTVNLSMNDGIISTFDINRNTAGFKNQLVMVLDDLINEFESLNFRDVSEGFPGVRGILTFGHRYNYTHVGSTVAVINNKTIAYHPREFQMNTAFSKAYIMESSGSKAGIAGNNLYIDKYLLDSIENLIIENNDETHKFRIESQLDDSLEKKYFSIYRDSDFLLKLQFDTDIVKYEHHGINTTLYKFHERVSRQDELAHEAEFKRAQRYSQMENEEIDDSE